MTRSDAIPLKLLESVSNELVQTLVDKGLRIERGSDKRKKLIEYLHACEPALRMKFVSITGWHGDTFVFPDGRSIAAASNEAVLFQSSSVKPLEYGARGTLDEWRDNVASLCKGNSRLIFAVGKALSVPMQDIVGHQSSGIHFVGRSSIGKTSTLYVAASAYGSQKCIQGWRNTVNGLEAQAAARNDLPMFLDEIGQANPHHVDSIVYMVMNEAGKDRASRNGGAKQAARWRTSLISTGEVTVSECLASVGRSSKAGQEVRLVTILADAEKGSGLFENTHGSTGDEFAKKLKANCASFYGTAAPVFINYLSENKETLAKAFHEYEKTFLKSCVDSNANGQVSRVASQFALAGFAGAVATQIGLTGWPANESTEAAQTCFRAWKEDRGGSGAFEDKQILESIQMKFERNARSFVHVNEDDMPSPLWGYYNGEGDSRTFYVTTNMFNNEICKGLSARRAKTLLRTMGVMETEPDGKGILTTVKDRRSRYLHIKASVLSLLEGN